MALRVVHTCQEIEGGIPDTLKGRMIVNVFLDFGIGLIPFLGDIADALFRANTRNAWLLEVYLTRKAEAERKGHVSDPELGNPQMPARPNQARLPSSRGGGGGLGFLTGKTRQADEEMAMGNLNSQGQAQGIMSRE
jgi:hypothetical protein